MITIHACPDIKYVCGSASYPRFDLVYLTPTPG
jgi:hypothetical protein